VNGYEPSAPSRLRVKRSLPVPREQG
jgi:hypothetical protein